MDYKQALLVIQSALKLARDHYNTLLMHKISTDLACGYDYLMLALSNVSDRIHSIEDEQNEGE